MKAVGHSLNWLFSLELLLLMFVAFVVLTIKRGRHV
jgi:hypothetical protein